MPPIRSNDNCCHASSPGSAPALADQQIHTANASASFATGQIQANGAPTTFAPNQEDTSDPAPTPLTKRHEDGSDEAMDDPHLVEPDQWAFQPIFTGRLVWSAKLSDKPIVPFEELPLPKSDHTRITVPSNQLVVLSEVSLVFNKTSLQRVLIGSALPQSSLALEILDNPQANAPTATARYVAQSLKAYVQVHNVWIWQVSYHNDPMPPADTNVYVALISTPAGDEGGLDPVQFCAIPSYVQILTNNCELNYVG
ncbi:hypothetical protein NDA13_004525 [Ustilago tritici]|nr:hypothetical protein NDA13_004525 [Ustilago tritici]